MDRKERNKKVVELATEGLYSLTIIGRMLALFGFEPLSRGQVWQVLRAAGVTVSRARKPVEARDVVAYRDTVLLEAVERRVPLGVCPASMADDTPCGRKAGKTGLCDYHRKVYHNRTGETLPAPMVSGGAVVNPAQIYTLLDAGYSVREIVAETGVKRNAVQRIRENWKKDRGV